uniref:Uncharacterized protein n=1 Tax=Physcomitrium patens TaxID=3218 RepID=A0A2K1JS42_PHYPA|nr:hypothetical protein PHYPA_016732 [Physcomitrium patens]
MLSCKWARGAAITLPTLNASGASAWGVATHSRTSVEMDTGWAHETLESAATALYFPSLPCSRQ